ncbi:hypothetical protein [Microbacterium sp. LWH13-1.2]|uniref:hypothetical protein n=1 Tax=Microbacterium sp. LWH13-1.2 TaxID=3135260 RepID=UPI0031399589
MTTPPLDIAEALDSVAKVLGVLTATVAVVTALTQAALPSLLRRREKWIREALNDEPDESRAAFLRELHVEVSASIVAGMLVPGWRFLMPVWLLFVGVAQFFLWTRNSPEWWSVVLAFLASLVVVAIPIRRAIRLLCERARIAYEYRADPRNIQRPRLGSLSQAEGGTRREFWLALIAAGCVNLASAGVVVWSKELVLAGLVMILVAIVVFVGWWDMTHRYIRSRKTIYGPWSTADPTL